MKVKYRFWATDDVDVKESVVKINVSKFFNDAAKAAHIKNEWNKWANSNFGDAENVHGGWEKKRRWFS